jgi:hypothetical protein
MDSSHNREGLKLNLVQLELNEQSNRLYFDNCLFLIVVPKTWRWKFIEVHLGPTTLAKSNTTNALPFAPSITRYRCGKHDPKSLQMRYLGCPGSVLWKRETREF